MRRHIKTFLGYLLTITLIFSDLSIVTYAEESAGSTGNQTIATDTEAADVASETEGTLAEPEIISELTDKRDEKTKYFAMSDGTIKACIYPQNVHYLEDGEYEEIDNTLVETIEDDRVYYKNKKNGFSLKMPETFADDYIEFSDENGYVRFRLQGATNKKIEKLEKEQTKKNADKTVVNNVNDKAIFKSIKGDIDIEYDLAGNKLKETIVLYKKTKNSFVFDVQTSAASAEVNTDNSISFFDSDGAEIYMIASPYMTDSAGEYSNAVETKLVKNENGYTLTYTPDYEWLSAKEREYPVKIDPTLFQAIYKETVTDTYISNVQTSSNPDIRGTWDVLNIGRRTSTIDGEQLIMRGLIRFEIPSEIGKTDCIVDAKLDLVHYTDSSAISVNGIQIDVHELKAGFIESSTWWDNQPLHDESIITDYAIVNTSNTFSGTTLSYDSYNITRLVNKWHNGSTNYGIMLKLHDEDTTVTSSKQVYYFAKQSTYYGSVSKFAEITYRNATGLEDYWSYTSQDFGQYGIGYVNNYNGNLVYVHDDVSFNSLINGFTLSHVYNTNLSGTGMGYYGSGWRLNLVQQLEPVTVTGNSSVKYVYTDGDGTRHYFVQNSDGKIVDEDGLGYTYEDINEGELTRKITDKNGTIYKFDTWSFLRRIIDSNGNTILLHYSPGTTPELNHLTAIATSSGGTILLTYNGNNLVSITDNSGRNTTFKYNLGNLTEIHYPDGTILKFEYDASNHWLQKIVSPDGTKLSYGNYSPSEKISLAQIFGTDGTASSKTSFQYSQNQTRVIDSYNRGITYQFDTWGRPTCVYDDEQNIYSQTYNTTVTSGSGIFNNNKLASSSHSSIYVNNLLANAVFTNGLTNWGIYTKNANAQFTVVTDNGLITSKSVKITNDQKTIEVITQSPTVNTEGTYTYSGYIKTENVQSGDNGASLEVVVSGPSGNKFYYSEFMTGTTDSEIDNGFKHVSVTFTLAKGEYIARVTAGLYNASGTVYIDSLQLEEGDTANQINLINNSSFENNSGAGSTPANFTLHLGTSGKSGVVTSTNKGGSASCSIVGEGAQTRSLYQTLSISGKGGDVYSFGGWAKANATSNRLTGEDNGGFKMCIRITYTDGTYLYISKKFNEYVSDWQYVMKTFIIPKDYAEIQLYCSYDYNCNTVYFDNIFLYCDTMQSYIYDDNGNVVSTSDYASQNSTFNYQKNNLTQLINADESSYEYGYDTKNNMVFARSNEGLQYDIEYDTQGNVTNTLIGQNIYSSSISPGRVYLIRNKNSGKYLTCAGTDNTANVTQTEYTGDASQKWRIVKNADGSYGLRTLINESFTLDVVDASSVDGTNIKIYNAINHAGQRFKILINNDFTYKILTGSTSYSSSVSIVNGSTENNANVLQNTYLDVDSQKWYFEDATQSPATEIKEGCIYQFRARHSGKYIDLKDETTDIGTLAQQYEGNYSSTQKYILNQYEDTDYFTFTSYEDTNKILEISAEVNSIGYKYLQLGDNIITDSKLFKLEYNKEKQGFYIIPKIDETLALDVAYYMLSNGASLIFTTKGANINRFFIAEKFSDTITSSATYQDNGNYPHTTTDACGNTTTYTYDTSRGLQTGVTDAKGNTTSYTYNALNDRLESVSSGDSTVSYQYETNGSIKNITTANGTIYNFLYDVFGRTSRISVGSQVLSETIYKDEFSALVKQFNYGNGVYKTYTYDDQDRLISESINGTEIRTYVYDKSGNIAKITDLITNVTTAFRYDLIGRIVEMKTSDGQSMNFVYDKFNRLSLSKWSIGNTLLSSGYIYGDNSVDGQTTGLIYGVNLNGTQQLSYQYDELARLKTRTLNTTNPFVTEYGYLEGAATNTTTTLVKTVKNGNDTLEYTYDELGNITSVAKNGTIIETYTYDSLGQLTSATYGENTFTYAYDNSGNITEIKKNDVVIKSYTYGNSEWKDLLTAFNSETITYDAIGNPLTYRNAMNFTWQNGRQLASVFQNGNAVATYTYNADGLRTSKTVNGITTEYYWQSGTLYGQKIGDEYIFFLYDENGSVYGFIVQNGTEKSHYYYEFNLQGDIIGIIDSTGSKVVEYTYGAWGDIISTTGTHADTIGQKNPLRYRGYYYDAETGFYYVSSRYYDPEIGRFINADGYVSTGQGVLGNNMFAYCGNNPINRKDPSGQGWITALLVTAVVVLGTFILSGCAKPTSDVGAAKPYVDMSGSDDPTSPNCYAYAIGSPVNEQPGAASGRVPTKWNDVNDVGKSVEADLKGKGYSVRKISGPNAKVYENEFKIALRVGTKPYAYDVVTGKLYYDYHFMRQTDTGQWAEKHGIGGSSVLWDVGMTPDTIPWTLNDVPYYDSAIIYYAVGN